MNTIFTLNESMYSRMWCTKSILKRVIYCLLPCLLSGLFFYIIHTENAWRLNGGYGFWNDKTNLAVLTYMFITMYFVSGWYSSYAKIILSQYADKLTVENDKIKYQKTRSKQDKISNYLKFFSIFFALFGMWFIYIASLNDKSNWYSLLSNWQLVYYSFLVAACWYMSANVLLHSISVAVTIFKFSQLPINVDVYHNDGCAGFAEEFKLFFFNIGLAIYFVLSVTIIILSDFNAIHYNVENAFYKYPILILPIVLALAFYLIYTIIPLIEIRKVIYQKANTEMQNTELSNKKLVKLKKVYNSMFNPTNVIRIFFSNFLLILQFIINIWF